MVKQSVSSRIAQIIIRFCREHRCFHAYELREAVTRADAAPGSADRGLRALRQQGVIDYRIINRHDSLYEVTAINVGAEGSDAMLDTASLEELEAIIGKGIGSFIETGNALVAIRGRHLYREQGFGTFEEYCRKRWNMSRIHGHRMIEAAGVAENLLPIGNIPQNEAQARELVPLSPERQREIAATIDFKHMTASQIRALVQQELPAAVKPTTKTRRIEHDFCRRLFSEFMRRRREADLANSKRVWNPDAICKVDLINILVWVESELQTYINGHSVKVREKAKKRPQLGKGINHDRETNVGNDPADAGVSPTI